MKRYFILVLVFATVVFPLAAKTNLINFGYNIHGKYNEWDGLKMRSMGVDFIHVGGDRSGFYSQINPYYGMSLKDSDGYVVELSDIGTTLIGLNSILGYGGDLNFGSMGLIIGGGIYLDVYAVDTLLAFSSGLGLGANFYFQPGAGNFVINAGLSFAWRPYTYYLSDISSEEIFDGGKTNTNFNIGLGWRTGGIGSKSSKTSSSSGGSGSSDW